MPVLSPPVKATVIDLPARKAALAAKTEVLVVGGGPAGIGAALGAAHAGAEVVLVERYGFLGGNATVTLVEPFVAFHTHSGQKHEGGKEAYRLWPTDHGPGEAVIAGALKELLTRLLDNGGAVHPTKKTGYTTSFDPEIFKWTALDMLDEAGIKMLFHAFASGVVKDGLKVTGVVFETKSGPIVIRAKTVIDCTGDGDIASAGGAEYEIGREADGLTQPMTLMFRMVGFSPDQFKDYVLSHPDQWYGVHGLRDLIAQAAKEGRMKLPREDILMFATPHKTEVCVNSTRIIGLKGINVWDLSAAEILGRRQMREIVRFLNYCVPGFAGAYLVQSGTQVGVRESRRIKGLYTLLEDDVLFAKKFPDVIARNAYPIDIHNPEGKGTFLINPPGGEAYDIPLRCLIPVKIEQLLVGGRCLSSTHEANASCRSMPACIATGQAAGVCAALAVKQGVHPRAVPADHVQSELIRQGADLGQGIPVE